MLVFPVERRKRKQRVHDDDIEDDDDDMDGFIDDDDDGQMSGFDARAAFELQSALQQFSKR